MLVAMRCLARSPSCEVAALKTSRGAFRAAVLLQEGSICVWLLRIAFQQILEPFFRQWNVHRSGAAPKRATCRHGGQRLAGACTRHYYAPHGNVGFHCWRPISSKRTSSRTDRNDEEENRHENTCRCRIGEGQAARGHGRRSRRAEGRRGPGRGQGDRHLPHRRVHAVGRRSGGAVPGDPRARGRRRRGRGRPRRHLGEEGRPRHPALHAGMPAVPVLPLAQDQSLHRHPRRRRARA